MPALEIYAVTGSPVLHSLSPLIFRRAFEAADISAIYTRLAAASAAEAIDAARRIGLSGMNVTSPFKEEVVPLIDELDESAASVGAVNAVAFCEGRSLGFNVDAEGVAAMCVNANFHPEGESVAVLGAGGAASAAAFALRRSGANVTIVNRSRGRGEEAARRLGCRFALLDEASGEIGRAAAVFACWPKSARDFDSSALRRGQILFDANYGDSTFADAAIKSGCRYVDGTAWLIGQAIACFEIFTGKGAPVEAMRNSLNGMGCAGAGHIVLTGMMGSGKSEAAAILAGKMGLESIDTDEMVERMSGRRIAKIFEECGEAEFRRLEAAAVEEALARPRSVIALGGGALTDPDVARMAMERGAIFWLWASPERCAERISAGSRPLLAGRDPVEALSSLLEERLDSYARASDLIVSTDERDAEGTARKIFDEISESGKR